MWFAKSWRPVSLLAATVACILVLGACSAGSLGSSDDEGGATTLTFLVDNADGSLKPAQGLAEAFHAKNPDITVQVQTRPGGSEGDNIVKTRLSTGEMTDVFLYNSGSLFQALNPQQSLTPLTGEAWANQVDDTFKPVVSVGNELYGAPITGSSAGGILYNRKVYEQLGLQVPTTWTEFMANNAKIKAAGIDPVIQTYQDTWTSQLFVLADYHNVAAADPDWAEKYTAGQVKYAQEPAVKGFQRLEEVHKAGYENKDYRSMKFEKGVADLAAGKGAHFPMLTFAVGTLAASDPEHINDVGFFGQPGDDASKAGMTIWMPAGLYIPKSTEGAQLEAAKKFVAFVASPEGCEVQTKAYPRLARTWSRAARCRPTPRRRSRTWWPTWRRGTSRPHWSSSPPSRDRPWSRSPSRSVRDCDLPRPGPRSTTKTSRSRLSSWVSRAGSSAGTLLGATARSLRVGL
jgi:raffinose/stachyose/melibiose transport system substrate-binding protein